jgi:Uncharacterized protein conserved in bacteria
MTRSGGVKQTQHQQQSPAVIASANGSFQANQSGTEFFDLQRDAGNRLVGEWLKVGLRNSVPPVIQRKPVDSGTTRPAEQQADQAAQHATARAENGAPARSLIVEDDAQSIAAGQMRKGEFLTQLRIATNRAAEQTLAGTMWSSLGCPYIERWFGHYEGQSAQYVERAIQKFTPEARGASNARDYIPAVANRVRSGIEQWRETGVVPPDVPEEFASGGMPGITAGALIGGLVGGALSAVVSAVSGAAKAVGGALFKEREGGAAEVTEPEAIRAQLGSGRSLDGAAKSRMESALGANFSSVRVHTDAKAHQLSNSLNARAFTIGSDIAFGPGEYNPGTLVGDALIAHELAHVEQQRGGAASASPLHKGGGESSGLEEDADTSAVGAVVALWGRTKLGLAHVGENAMPRLKSGLQLQRCSKNVNVRSPAEVQTEYDKVKAEILSGLPADDPARSELELDLIGLWSVYEQELEAAKDDKKRQAEAQEQLSTNLKRMKETVSLQVELTKRYKINFTARESGKVQGGEIRVSFRAWSPDELKEVDRVLSQVPAKYLERIRKIERSPETLNASVPAGKETPPPHTAASWNESKKTLRIHDLFFSRHPHERPGILLHEIGHSTIEEQDPKKTGGFVSLPPPEWMALSDWKLSTSTTLKDDLKIDDKQTAKLIEQLTANKTTQGENPRPVEVNGRMVVYDKYEGGRGKPPAQFLHYSKKEDDHFISDYARTHPAEDFAESFSRYLHDAKPFPLSPDAKKALGPAKWAYLEKNYPEKLKGDL